MKSLLIVTALAAVAAAQIQVNSAGTTSGSVVIDGKVVNYAATGSAKGSYTGNSATGNAKGEGIVQVQDFGTVYIRGTVDGSGSTNFKDQISVDGSINGEAFGPNGLSALGAARGQASYDKGKASAKGDINGQASADGYTVRGNAQGAISGQIDSFSTDSISGSVKSLSGSANGCIRDPTGKIFCGTYVNNNQVPFTGTWENVVIGTTGGGSHPGGSGSGGSGSGGSGSGGSGSGGSGSGSGGSSKGTTSNPPPVYGGSDSSSASALGISIAVSALAGMVALLF